MLLPLTYQYKKIFIKNLSSHSLFDKSLDYFEELMRRFAIVAISIYNINELNDIKINSILEKLSAPSLGDWNNFINTILKWSRREQNIKFSEILNDMENSLKQRIENKDIINIYRYFSKDLDDKDVNILSIPFKSIIDMIIRIRNKIAHGGKPSEEWYKTTAEYIVKSIDIFIKEVNPLSQWSYGYYKNGMFYLENNEESQLEACLDESSFQFNNIRYKTVSSFEERAFNDNDALLFGENRYFSLSPFIFNIDNEFYYINGNNKLKNAVYINHTYGLTYSDNDKILKEQIAFFGRLKGLDIKVSDLGAKLATSIAELGNILKNYDALSEYKVIGDYKLIEEIGRGGMGIVFKALQISTNRVVALKVLPKSIVSDETIFYRFKREAKALEEFDHPHIVEFIEFRETDDDVYLAMEYIDGIGLDEIFNRLRADTTKRPTLEDLKIILTNNTALPSSFVYYDPAKPYYYKIVDWILEITSALVYVHSLNILHRDIKPSNIMIEKTTGRAVLLDFGLAKTREFSITTQGQFLGTVRYASPEQISAVKHVVDERSDIYSVGVVLYELLSLRPMFIGNSLEQLSSQILTIDPPKIKIITPDIPNDLDTITHKSLEKNQKYRYQLMTEVNEDLTRWKENKPIKAKPPTTFQKITKWVKRNPLKTGIVAASFVAAIILLIFGWITINEIIRQKNIAIENLKRVSINKSKLNLDTKYYQDALINLYKSINYSKNISPTQQVYYNNIIKHNFECLSTFFWDNNRIQSMDSNRDIIVCGSSGKKNNLIVLNSKTFEKITVLDKHKDSITNVRFSIDKSYFITGSKDKTVNIWNSKSLELLNSDRIKLADCINDIEFSNDGKYFIISTGGYREQNNIIYLFDAKTLKPIKSINSDFKYLTSIAFTNDLNFLIAGNNNSIRIWNLNDIIASDATDNYKTIENCHDARISSILFINDDKTMITSSWDNTIKFWDFSALRLIKSLNAHDDIVNTIKIYNEKYLISISNDKTIKFRDLNTFNLLLVLKGHNNSVNDLCFLNNSLYTCSDDSTIKIWNIKDIGDNIFLEESISNIALSPNSKYLAVANSLSNIVNIYEYQKDNSFQNGFVKIEHDDIISDLIFSNDSKTLFCASKKSIIIYDLLKDKKELLCYDITDDIITSLSVSPDLKYIITGSLLNKIVIWNIKNKKRITIENLRHNDLINSISVSPDNNYFASVSRDSLVVLRSLNEFKEITILRGHTDSVLKAVFSPDSRYLITCSRDKTIKIWDVKSLEQVKNIEILNEPSFIAISNDSKFLLCGTVAGSLLLWDYKNYEFIFKYDILKNESVNNIVISSNSDYIYACSESKIVKEEIKTSYSKNDIKRYYDYYIPYDLDQNDQLIFKNDIVEILKNRNSDDKYVNYFKNSKIDYKDLFSNEYENNISYLFFYSIKNSDTLLLKSLLKSNNNIINILDSLGNNGLYYAVNQRNIKIVKLLIKNKIDVNFKDNNGYTPLYYASKNGYTEICEFLIKNKALIIDDNIKLSSLYIAVIENQIETLKVLLKYVDKKYLYIEDSDGKSLLDLIQNNLNKDIQKLLLQS